MKHLHKPIHILLVEDNMGDIRLTQEAFKDSQFEVNLEYVTDGAEAIKYLQKEDKYADKGTPDLVLLDLNLPKRNGHEVLEYIKGDEELCTIPVLMLTTSTAPRDVRGSYILHANCYINKPIDFNQFNEVIRQVENFWLMTATLPN